MENKKGFTLVELLAVIVILAIVLVIAVPQIMKTIESARKGTFESNAKLIAGMAEKKALENETLGIKDTILCSDVAKLNTTDYSGCGVKIKDGVAKVTIIGSGKFEGMYICGGTKTNAVVSTAACAVEPNTQLTVGTGGLIETSDGNIRYVGADEDVNNYVTFNNGETWRIIGVFDVKTSEGITENLIKIVKESSLGDMLWDSSASTINEGKGINEWSVADLQKMLNGYYIGKESTCSYCTGRGQATCTNDCSSSVTPLNSTAIGMIENVVWNTGAPTWSVTKTLSDMYSEERGTQDGKKLCTDAHGKSYATCNDEVERETTWKGLVGLIYPSDYGYASSDEDCKNDLEGENSTCNNNNWLHPSSSSYWTLSPQANSGMSRDAWLVKSDSRVSSGSTNGAHGIRPSVYLKFDVKLTGLGTSESPYTLSR